MTSPDVTILSHQEAEELTTCLLSHISATVVFGQRRVVQILSPFPKIFHFFEHRAPSFFTPQPFPSYTWRQAVVTGTIFYIVKRISSVVSEFILDKSVNFWYKDEDLVLLKQHWKKIAQNIKDIPKDFFPKIAPLLILGQLLYIIFTNIGNSFIKRLALARGIQIQQMNDITIEIYIMKILISSILIPPQNPSP